MGIKVLDCTLRDGGYVNNWEFSEQDIKSITKNLNTSGIDFIELGYLSQTQEKRGTIFNSFEEVKKIKIPYNKKIIMVNLGEFQENQIPENRDYVFGIRIVFKREQWKKAFEYGEKLIAKGYKVFLQPMQTGSYPDKEILDMIERANFIKPYALYIVDSFGEMKKEDLHRLVSLYAHNLDSNISIGFHSHNNLQLSFALAIEFSEILIKQDKIIDSSVYGMGRGAGNLNTELFIDYLNKKYNKEYALENILKIMDFNLEKIYQKENWGYNLGHFLSAKLGCHPNYASYLLDKRTLGIESIKNILKNIPEENIGIYNKKIIENLYEEQQHENYQYEISDSTSISLDKKVLLIAPGSSVLNNLDKIKKVSSEDDVTVISLNHKNIYIKSDYIFFGNEKRYQEYLENFKKKDKLIVTSNIKKIKDTDYILDYEVLSDKTENNSSSILLLEFLKQNENLETIYLAGFDGYVLNHKNYFYETQESKNIDEIQKINEIFSSKLKSIDKKIIFLTESIFNKENK